MVKFQGISLAYINEQGDIKTECYGFSDKENNVRVDENTIFPAASMSKFITSICVLKLHDKKVLDINDPVNKYLNKWKLRLLNDEESNVTIKSILSHTGGIIDGDDSFYGIRLDDAQIDIMDILEGKTSYNKRYTKVENSPGTEFIYSDAGYCILQLLIEEVTDKSFEEFVCETIFRVLKLDNAFYATHINFQLYEKKKHLSVGYDNNIPIKGKYIPCPDLASSGLWISPKEMVIIAKEFFKSINGKSDFLSYEAANLMIKPLEKFPGVGLGLFISEDNILITQGWAENAQCMMKIDLTKERISIVMTNGNPGINQVESGIEEMVNKYLL